MLEKFNYSIEIIDQTETVAKTGSWELDLISNELFWSNGVFRILEIEPINTKVDFSMGLGVIHPDDREIALLKMTEAIEKGIEYRIKKRFLTANNKIKHIISSGKVIKDENNNPIKIVGIFQDITEFVETNEKMELLNKITKDVIFDWDIQNDVFNWGESFTRLFGHKLDGNPFQLEDWDKLMHPIDTERHREEWNAFFNNPNASQWSKEFRFKKSDNSYAYVEENAIVIRDGNGNPIKMIGLLRDITTKKVVEIQKKIQNQISLICKQPKNTDEILEDILDYLTKYDNFLSSEIWLLNSCKTAIRLKKWSSKNNQFKKFHSETKDINSFEKGKGLPGIVWKTEKHLLWQEDEITEKFLREASVKEIGVKSILAIPIFNNNDFIGSILFYSKNDLTLHEIKTEPYLSLSNFLGDELRRKTQEDMHRLMFESAPDIIATVNSNGFFTNVNPSFCELLGFTEKELTSNHFTFFLHPEDLKSTELEYEETISGSRKANNFTNRYRTKNGDYKWIAWSSSDVFGEENTSFAYGRNISEITELQHLFQETAKLAEIGSWEYDKNKKAKPFFLSQVVKDILELKTHKNISFKSLLALVYEEDQSNTGDIFLNLIENGKHFDSEFRIKTNSGNLKWVRCIGKSETNTFNKKTKVYGSIQNITKQKNNELELAKKNFYLSSIANVISELMHSEDWFQSLHKVFEVTGNTIDVDRIYYFEIDETSENEQKTCSQKIEWTKDGITPQINNPDLQNVPIEAFTTFFDPLLKGKHISGITSKFPEGNLKENLESQSIKSFLVLPLFINNIFYGFVGFDDCINERRWSNSEITFLNNIVYNLSTTIQRKKANYELEKSLEEKNNILESIDDAFISLDQNWIVKYWNKKSESIVNLSRDQIIGKNFWDVFPQLLGTIYEKNYKEAFEHQKSINFQDYFEELKIWLDITIYPSKNGLSVYYKDITNTKKYEDALKASNDRFEKSTAATNEAIWDWDVEKNTMYRGEGFYKSFGYKVPSFINNTDILNLIKSRVRPDQADAVINSLVDAINNPEKENWRQEYWYKKANDEYAFIINNGVIIRNEEGKAIRIVGALQDITHLKEQEDSLRILNKKLEKQTKALLNSNQELEQFAYVASHDLQEPLRMVTSFLTHLEKKYDNVLDDKGKQYIYFAVDGANRMRNIILDILEYSRVGKVKEESDKIDLNKLIDEVCKINNQTINETQAKIIYDKLPIINSYKTPLTQILHNLIGNALKYQHPNKSAIVKIKVVENDKNWHFKIKDNGIGIDKEFHDKIFVIFQRLHTKQEYSGSGMGLAIVKKIIENLNGTIWVESEVNKGSTFHFTLPKK
ncbi:PAS domain S-box-containing protein [Flavobacterium aquaticum]|uniref:histidine kinase n=1 Tax=Flavobacterium aquaticum TaxID=1236486 RepID=A0A327YRD6_9FLAO|nr:PAS domain-containing protein [Flavobacterium aquaticum]RAK22677.1 PAS domain S-box-containing protein [Flavobacterium aquaticum]